MNANDYNEEDNYNLNDYKYQWNSIIRATDYKPLNYYNSIEFVVFILTYLL